MDEVLIITGASRGIGAATARIAGRSGYAVCVNYLKNKAAAMKIVEEIKVDGGRALAVGADISREEEVVKLFRTVDDKLGKISALVNNAGILETQMRIEDMDAARLNRVFLTNITGSFFVREGSSQKDVHKKWRKRWSDCQCVIRCSKTWERRRICGLCCIKRCD